MHIKSLSLKSVSPFAFILAIGMLVGTIVFATTISPHKKSVSPTPVYPKNASGQTYGSSMNSTSPETEPDLIRASGIDGTIGYVRAKDLRGDLPKTTKEALEMQAKQTDQMIPLYDVEGKKVIGKFKVTAHPEIKENQK